MTIPIGFCMCGCGQRTAIAARTKNRDGWVKGRPLLYVRYHFKPKNLKRSYTVEQRKESATAYIRARVRRDDATGCWLWTAAIERRHGYAKFSNCGRLTSGHRASYEVFVGPIPAGMLVCHKCDTPRCVNPDHLFLGTSKDNTQDMLRKGRRPKHYRGRTIGSGTQVSNAERAE